MAQPAVTFGDLLRRQRLWYDVGVVETNGLGGREKAAEMTSLTIELNEVTFARLEHEANRRGVDIATYVRDLLNQETAAPKATESQAHPRTQKASADSGRWLDSPEAIVDWIRAQREKALSVREATADLADLLASGGVDQGVPVDIWERRWAVQEEAEKAAERADLECALREQKAPRAHDLTE